MAKQKAQAQIVLLDDENSGRDEMNLAGNPFALLQAASRTDQSLISYAWDRRLKNGRVVKASWEVSGHQELGLPGPTEELLYLVLMQLTREAAEGNSSKEWPRQVFFSRRDVLRRMGWNYSAPTYANLKKCFQRLTNVTINAEHSFYNRRADLPYETISFHILDDFSFTSQKRGRKVGENKTEADEDLSWFRWNETLHESFLAGNVRSLALDFVLSLELALARRLFRLLELFRHSGPHSARYWEIGIFKLRDRLGMARYAYPSKIREKLTGAVEELIETGYLREVVYRKGRDGDICVFHFGDAAGTLVLQPKSENSSETPRVILSPNAELVRQIPTSPAPPPIQLNESPVIPGLEPLTKKEKTKAVPRPRRNPLLASWDEKKSRAKILLDFFHTLEKAQQDKLLEEAQDHVTHDFWDRLLNPESPISEELTKIIERDFGASLPAKGL